MIALGTLIAYTHRAEVVRRGDGNGIGRKGEWCFHKKGASAMLPMLNRHGDGYVVTFVAPKVYNAPAEFALEPTENDNKSVIVWPEAGAGVVTGLITKQIGKSEPSRGGMNMYGEGDYEIGWFSMRGKVELYVVRWELKGSAFVYVPTHAAVPAAVSSE